jgi:phage tail sheath protein FI
VSPQPPDLRSPWQTNPREEFTPDTLLAVHRSLLRVCAARGDLLGVLAVPDHFREPDAIAYTATLTSTTGPAVTVYDPPGGTAPKIVNRPLGDREAVALSYGAVYHPWLYDREENDPSVVRRVPPDGVACGIVARRALSRGPWVAPANEVFQGVVGLVPDIDPSIRLALQEARVNLVRAEPRGFLVLDADTLSPDENLRSINVRRLLTLLRRLALRLGADYVFEPNDPPFRRAVQRAFEGTLGYLFDRGAFAGRTPAESFRVVVDDRVNPPGRVEQGLFVVELRVAPSQPLTFLTVRLVQDPDRGLGVGGS